MEDQQGGIGKRCENVPTPSRPANLRAGAFITLPCNLEPNIMHGSHQAVADAPQLLNQFPIRRPRRARQWQLGNLYFFLIESLGMALYKHHIRHPVDPFLVRVITAGFECLPNQHEVFRRNGMTLAPGKIPSGAWMYTSVLLTSFKFTGDFSPCQGCAPEPLEHTV